MPVTQNTSISGGNSKDKEDDDKVQAFSAVALNDYEKLRAKNIERNNAKLRAFGLISAKEEKQSNDRAWKRAAEDEDDTDDGIDEDEYNPENDDDDEAEDWVDIRRPLGGTMKRKRKKGTTTTASSSPSRKSLRLQGKTPNGSMEVRKKHSKEQLYQERIAMVQECREARQRAAVEVAKAGQKIAAKENPTATYEHCLMRVKTMTDKKITESYQGY
mmetsp:Transcript_30113/g.46163  ORF Transcript_30113/g.46163 Transcript_30113/m.46163 type:complete len:216 (-) Transcript_30113:166-813(-)